MRNLLCKAISIAFCFICTISNAQTSAGTAPTFRMTGDANLMTNYIQRGLSHSKKDPALLAAFWFNFGSQFRMGLSGSNVAYTGEDAHFNLKILTDVKMTFSANADLVIKYTMDRYYKSTVREGDIFGLVFNSFGFRTYYERFSNWEGSSTVGTWYGFGTDIEAFSGWILESTAGFTQTSAASGTNYFDVAGILKHKSNQLTWSAGLTGTTAQIGDRSGFFLVLGAKADF